MRLSNLPVQRRRSNGSLAKAKVNNSATLLKRWKDGGIGFDPMRHLETMDCAFCGDKIENYRYDLHYANWQPCCASCKRSSQEWLPHELDAAKRLLSVVRSC